MALIVEDGQALEDAQSFASVADFDAYCTANALVMDPAPDEAAKELLLARGTRYIELLYSQRMKGMKLTKEQALSYPRSGVSIDGFDVAEDEIPQQLIDAVCEAAYRYFSGELIEDIDANAGNIKREKIGPLETEYFAPASPLVRFRIIDLLMAKLLNAARFQGTLVRG